VAGYPDIGDHGLIGDLQTAALVTTDGVLDWFCCPRFDSPSVFASLLDAERGGFYRIAPDRDDYVTRQLYLPDTAILVTRFMTPDGVGEVHDFRPAAIVKVIGRALRVKWMWIGVGMMTLAFFSLLAVLSVEKVSFVVPVTALSYVAGALGGRFFLGERITLSRWTGIALVCIGVTLVFMGKG